MKIFSVEFSRIWCVVCEQIGVRVISYTFNTLKKPVLQCNSAADFYEYIVYLCENLLFPKNVIKLFDFSWTWK